MTSKGTVETTYIDSDCNEITLKGDNPAPEELLKAFRGLVPYFADITEQREAQDSSFLDIDGVSEKYNKLEVTGFTLSRGADGSKAILTGTRQLETNGTIVINTPKIKIANQDSLWELCGIFPVALEKAINEVEKYVQASQVKAVMHVPEGESSVSVNADDNEYPNPEEDGEAPEFID